MEQKNQIKIQVQNLHCYSCSRTFNDFNTFCSHHHVDNTSGRNQNKVQDDSEPRTDGSSKNCDFTPSKEDKQVKDLEKIKQEPDDTSPSTVNHSSIDQPSTKRGRKPEKKLENFYHCPNCYEVFKRRSLLKDHFANCSHKPTESFQESQLNRIQNNINNDNAKPSDPNKNNNIDIGNETSNNNNNEVYYDLEVRCTKCQLDFIFFDDLIDHLKILHLKSTIEPIHPPDLSFDSSSLQPQKIKRKRKSRKKVTSIQRVEESQVEEILEDSTTTVQNQNNEENIVDSLPDDNDDNDDDVGFENDNNSPTNDFDNNSPTNDFDNNSPTNDFDDPCDDENDNVNKINENENDPEWKPSKEERTDAEQEENVLPPSSSHSDKKKKKRKRPNTSNDDDDTPQVKKKKVRKEQKPNKDIFCDVPGCGANFASQKNVRRHKKNIHGIIISTENKNQTPKVVDKTKFMCELCGTFFRKKFDMNQHLLIHTGERNWTCSFEGCGRPFTRKTHLQRHERNVHQKELNFLCFTCGIAFRDNHSLQSHANLHTGVKPFKCEIENCGKAYAGIRSLRAHMVTHKNERKFKCEHCSAAFNFLIVLKKHLQTHEGTKTIKPRKSSP